MRRFFKFSAMPDDTIRFQITELDADAKSEAQTTTLVHFLTLSEMQSLTRCALETLGTIPPNKHGLEKNPVD